MGQVLLGIAAVLIILLLWPVTYSLTVDRRGCSGRIRLLGGLWEKEAGLVFAELFGTASNPENDSSKPPAADPSERTGYRRENKTKEEIQELPEKTEERHSDIPSGNIGKDKEYRESIDRKEDIEEETAERNTHPPKWSLVRYAWDCGVISRSWRMAGILWRHMKPRDIDFSGEWGLGDPMHTGVFESWAKAACPPFSHIRWNYIENVCTVRCRFGGRMIPLYVIGVALRFGLSRPVRQFWRYWHRGERS